MSVCALCYITKYSGIKIWALFSAGASTGSHVGTKYSANLIIRIVICRKVYCQNANNITNVIKFIKNPI